MLSIDNIKNILSGFFKKSPVIRAWIFGSYARNQQTPDSDLDILVEFDKNNYPSLLYHSSLLCELEDLLNLKIDLVPEEQVYPPIKHHIDHDKILIYERS